MNLYCLLISVVFITAHGYYDEASMTVIVPPKGMPPQSLFGYSITYQIPQKRLIISAPRADNIGKIFEADPKIGNITSITFNLTRIIQEDSTLGDYWLGAGVTSNDSYFVTCAPRISHYVSKNHKSIQSKCYYGSAPDRVTSLPSIGADKLRYFNGGITSLGWSIHINSYIFMGSPASQGGGVVVYEPQNQFQHHLVSNTGLPSFGYSLTSGRFIAETTSLVVGTIHGDYGQGKVLFYFYNKYFGYNNKEWDMSDGDIGSSYGAALCPLHLGGTRSSLLVGAPNYAVDGQYDAGAVYVYIPNYETNKMSLKRIVTVASNGGWFGTAIISVGDMDEDKLDEVAIAAPYEGGKGAVYLYSGAGLLADRKWFQRLQPRGFRMFGFSLTTMYNFSENGRKGLAIGAPASNKVVIYRSIPAITVILFKQFPNLQNRNDTTSFEFTTGVKVKYPSGLENISCNISVKIELIHPSARFANGEADGSLSFIKSLSGKPPVISEKIKVLTPADGDYDQEISYHISAELIQDPADHSPVMLSEYSVLSLFGSEVAADCEGACTPDLRANFTTSIPRPYISGSTEMETISISLTNMGQTAYTACVVITVHTARILVTPALCVREGDSTLTCKPRKTMKTGDIWYTGKIILETSGLTSADKNITIMYDVYNHCMKENDSEHHEEIFVMEPVSYGVIVQGMSNAEDMVNMTKIDVAVGKRLEHIYKITNTGPTSWVNLDCNVTFPKIEFKNIIETYATVSTDASVTNCSILKSSKTGSDESAHCHITDLRKNSAVNVYVTILILPSKLENILEKQDIKLNTTINLKLKEDHKSYSISNTLHYQCNYVSTWIILLALLFGLILLIVVSIALYKCGFLQRKKKKEIKNLRRSLKNSNYRRIQESERTENEPSQDEDSTKQRESEGPI